jgi:hypothetical protein
VRAWRVQPAGFVVVVVVEVVVVVVGEVIVSPGGVAQVVDVPVMGLPAWRARAPSIMHFMMGPATVAPVALYA